MKKILASMIPTFVMTCALAGSPDLITPTTNFDGLYVGIGGGMNIGQTKINSSTSTIQQPEPNTFFITGLSNNANQRPINGIGQVFLGYGKNFYPFYLGTELYGSITNGLKTSITNSVTEDQPIGSLANTIKANLNNGEFGIDLRPGFVWGTNTLLYARIGAAFNRISMSSNTVGQQFDLPTDVGTGNLLYNLHKNKVGLRLGLGLEEMISAHFSLRGDYIFTDYGKVSGAGIAAFSPTIYSGNAIQNQSSANIYTNAVMVSASYYFGNLI